MARRFPIFLSIIGLVLVSAITLIAFRPTAETFFLAVSVAALITVARSSPAPTRSFLKRLTARSDDPVPSTI